MTELMLYHKGHSISHQWYSWSIAQSTHSMPLITPMTEELDFISVKKKAVLARATPDEDIYTVWKGQYHTCPDYECLLTILYQDDKPMIHEYVRKNQHVNLFFDVDFHWNEKEVAVSENSITPDHSVKTCEILYL